jgi:hypothetical protein
MKKLFSAFLLVVSLACSSATTTASSTAISPADRHNTITSDDIAKSRNPGWYAYEVINQLRPNFLKAHNAVTLESRDPIYADVYVDEQYHGDIESLKSFPIDGITSITFLSPYDAATRFGKEMPGGAIMIRTH